MCIRDRSQPSLLRLNPQDIIRVVKLDQFNILQQEAARDLDRRMFTIDGSNLHYSDAGGKPVKHDSNAAVGFPKNPKEIPYPERSQQLESFIRGFGKPRVGEGVDFSARVSFAMVK